MRIVYVLPGPKDGWEDGDVEMARRGELLQSFAAPGTQVDIVDVPEGPDSIESMYEEYLSIPATIDRMVELEAEGYAAAISGCFGDPGIDGMREMLSIPVVGPGEASIHVAAMLGHQFSVLTVMENGVAPTRWQVRRCGLAEKLASVRPVILPVLEMGDDRARTLELLREQGELAVTQDGADTLVLGCMSMGFQMLARELSATLRVPVVNPAVVAVKAAELLVGAGLAHSKRAYMTPPKL